MALNKVARIRYRCPHMGITQPFRCVGALLSKAYSQEKGGTCARGQLLSDFETGKILVVCEETTAVRSIRLALNGTMNIFWHDPVDRVDHAEFEDYLEEEIVVWEPKRGDKEWMYPGQHEYPFEYKLSEKLPETMEESR